jgi:hypothetical protein
MECLSAITGIPSLAEDQEPGSAWHAAVPGGAVSGESDQIIRSIHY